MEKVEAEPQASLEKNVSDDYTTQLLRLRALTDKFGALHEAQVQQLRLWPFMVDPELEKAEAHVSIDYRKIKYIWKANHKKNFKPDKQYLFRLQGLSRSIRVMLGETWTFTVQLNGKTIFPIQRENGKSRTKSRKSKKPSSNRKR